MLLSDKFSSPQKLTNYFDGLSREEEGDFYIFVISELSEEARVS